MHLALAVIDFPSSVCCFHSLHLQAAQPRQNYLAVLKLADLGQGRHGKKKDKKKSAADDSSSDSESEDDDESMSGDESDEDDDSKEPPARLHHR